MRLCILISAICILTCPPAHAQAPDTLWTRTYGGTSDDVGRSMQLTPDGGCIIAGYTRSFGAGGSDVWLLRLDSVGNTLWSRTYGGSQDDEAYSVDLTFDGGYIVAGMTRSFGAGGSDVWLLKFSAGGDTQWARTCGRNWDDFGYSVRQLPDSGYIVGGEGYYTCNGWLLRYDALGDTLWTRVQSIAASVECVRQAMNGDLLLAGYSKVGSGYHTRTDPAGGELWAINSSGFNGVASRLDNGSVVVGAYLRWIGESLYVYLALSAYDSTGSVSWVKLFRPRSTNASGSSVERAGSGYIAVGGGGSANGDLSLVRVNPSGDSLWTKVVGSDSEDIGCACQQTSDRGFLIAGSTRSFGAGGADVWLIRLGPELIGIEEAQLAEVRTSVGATIVRGVLEISSQLTADGSRPELLDATGRRVAGLHPGANEVSRLAPGVYFVRLAPGVGRQAPRVTKVVVTR